MDVETIKRLRTAFEYMRSVGFTRDNSDKCAGDLPCWHWMNWKTETQYDAISFYLDDEHGHVLGITRNNSGTAVEVNDLDEVLNVLASIGLLSNECSPLYRRGYNFGWRMRGILREQ